MVLMQGNNGDHWLNRIGRLASHERTLLATSRCLVPMLHSGTASSLAMGLAE